jgi:anti-sigma factor RsiW
MREQDARDKVREPDCNRTRGDLKAYVDQELTPLRRWSVFRHLASCAACRVEAKEMVQIAEELARDEAEGLDPATRGSMVETLREAYGSDLPSVEHRRKITIPEFVVAASLIAVLAAIFFPVFAGVREKARNVSAASIAKQKMLEEQYDLQTQSSGSAAPSSISALSSPVATQGVRGTPTAIPGNVPDDESVGRQVHKSATITVQVADPEAGGNKIEDAVDSAGGFVTNSSLNTDPDGVKTAQMTIKVPRPQFEGTLAQIAKLGSVTAKNVTGEDITEKVSDADQRQVVLQQDMDQAQEQLKQKGAKTNWELQESARDLRIQLAQARARLKLLKSLAELSEIDVTLSQPPKAAPPVQTGFLSDVGNSGRGALESALGCLSTLIGVVFSILAYAPLWIPAWLLGRLLWRRYQARLTATL